MKRRTQRSAHKTVRLVVILAVAATLCGCSVISNLLNNQNTKYDVNEHLLYAQVVTDLNELNCDKPDYAMLKHDASVLYYYNTTRDGTQNLSRATTQLTSLITALTESTSKYFCEQQKDITIHGAELLLHATGRKPT